MKVEGAPLLDAPATTALAPTTGLESTSVTMFERLAKDPDVPVDKLERLIALQERILDREARMAFDAAFAEMQSELPVVPRTRKGDKWMYAPFEEIIERVRPILKKHGFSVSFETQWPSAEDILIVGHLTHRQGHERTSQFRAHADNSGSKNKIQAQGSTVQYGRRYTTLDLLGLSTGEDDDGHAAGKPMAEDAPKGFDDWVLDLQSVADEGTEPMRAAWRKSPEEMRVFFTKTNRPLWESIQRKALLVDQRKAKEAK